MSSLAPEIEASPKRPEPVRIVTAAALFDGHDAAINVIRRLLHSMGAEVIHLGHDRSVEDVVSAAVEEDADAVAVSSYQGGHLEYFRYLVDQLRDAGMGQVRVYGGGGGVIVPEEIETLHAYGVARIFSPEDGRQMGLRGMIRHILEDCRARPRVQLTDELDRLAVNEPTAIARLISWLESHGQEDSAEIESVRQTLDGRRQHLAPVVGMTGTGGAGKSSLVDELVRRFRHEFPERTIGLLSVDPTRRRSGGALLGDRIRLNAACGPQVFARSLATREAHLAVSAALKDAVRVLQASGFDLIFIETAGIGQGDSEIVDLSDVSLYLMTAEYGASSQLEKIDMIDLADLVVLNKFDRRGSEDALRDVRKQWRRNHANFDLPDEELPDFYSACRVFVFPSIYEGFGLPVLEAIQSGAVVAASNRSSIPEVGGEAVQYFDPESLENLVEALEIACFDRERRAHLREQALSQCDRFSWEKAAEQLLRLYQKLD